MKISELTDVLNKIKEDHGDLEVYYDFTDNFGSYDLMGVEAPKVSHVKTNTGDQNMRHEWTALYIDEVKGDKVVVL